MYSVGVLVKSKCKDIEIFSCKGGGEIIDMYIYIYMYEIQRIIDKKAGTPTAINPCYHEVSQVCALY